MGDIKEAHPRRDWGVLLAIYMIASAFRLLVWVFSTGDCHGAGAQYPGGCPAFTSGMDLQTAAFVGGGLVLLPVIQLCFMLLRPRKSFRLLILLLYAALLFAGPLLLLIPPPKA